MKLYLNVRIAFLDIVHYKTLNTRLDIQLLVINPPKLTWGLDALSRFVEKCESENFAMNSEYMQWLRSQNQLDHHLGNTGYAKKQMRW
jgi:hypothetical protein